MDRPNIILIVADTMRRDAIGIYNKNVSTPNIDALARDSMIYNNAISPSSWTVPSHASIFTGKYAIEHGLHETFDKKGFGLMGKMNDVKYETIAKKLLNIGYNTIGMASNPYLTPGSGFDRGFNTFGYYPTTYFKDVLKDKFTILNKREIIDEKTRFREFFHFAFKNGIRDTIEIIELYRLYRNKNITFPKTIRSPYNKGGFNIINNIENISIKEPFFLFINFMEMHDPYINFKKEPDSMQNLILSIKNNERILGKIRNRYYSQASLLDTLLGKLIRFLKSNNIYENTIIFFTSDHGQSMNKEFYGHGNLLTDDLIRVPLIIKDLDGKKGTIDTVISTTSVFDMITKFSNSENYVNFPNIAFSEAYGFQNDEALKYKNRIEKYRIAIFKDNYKLSIASNMEIDEFTYNGRAIDISTKKHEVDSLLEEIDIFLGNRKERLIYNNYQP